MATIADAPVGWYCLSAQPKREHVAAQMIQREVEAEAFCPQIRYYKKTRRGKVRFVEPLFPCYLFVHCDLPRTYRHLMSVHGVRTLITYAGHPPQVPDDFIAQLRVRIRDQGTEGEQDEIKPGMDVVLTEGPFSDWHALVTGLIPARERVRLMLEFLGRQITIEVPRASILREISDPRERVWRREP